MIIRAINFAKISCPYSSSFVSRLSSFVIKIDFDKVNQYKMSQCAGTHIGSFSNYQLANLFNNSSNFIFPNTPVRSILVIVYSS